jgi:subtilase family serine protease
MRPDSASTMTTWRRCAAGWNRRDSPSIALRTVITAFQTEIHNYRVDGQSHYANATELTIPAALSGVVSTIRNLDDFKPKPFVRFHAETTAAKPAFTSSQSGNHYLQPGDVAVIYDIKAAYSAGYTGAGQSVAVVGQSEISVSDIENFQSAAGLTVRDPTLVLVPNSGNAAYSSGDEAESDLDLEYSGGIAKEATLYLVYVGNNSNYSVWDSLQYAVDTDIAPVISMSYGGCEPDLSSSDYSTLESIMEQGASQGQSIVVASGDTGSTGCYADLTTNSTPTSQEEELAVNYPASSAFATALGGTEFPSSDVSSSNTTYWESASGNDVITSALSYIPEQVWNDDSATYGEEDGAEYALSAGGGWHKHFDRETKLAERSYRRSEHFFRQLSHGAGYLARLIANQCRLPLLFQRFQRYRHHRKLFRRFSRQQR